MPDEPIIVPVSPAVMLVKGQLRLLVAAVGGSLVLHKMLPADLVNDQTVDIVVGLLLLAAASAWQWARAQLVHRKLIAAAVDETVPATAVRVATPDQPANV